MYQVKAVYRVYLEENIYRQGMLRSSDNIGKIQDYYQKNFSGDLIR